MSKQIELNIVVKTRLNQVTKSTFKSYACQGSNGEWYTVRFTKDVPAEDLPVAFSKVYVLPENAFIDRRNDKLKLWIKKVEKVVQCERPIEDLTQYFKEVEDEQ